ncbi:hypothetical protein D3C87_1426820 [compost metagenome]
MEGDGNDRTFEHAVVDRGGKENQGGQGRPGSPEQHAGKQRDRQAGLDGITSDGAIDGGKGDARQHQADDRVQRAEAHGQGRSNHQPEHGAADGPPRHRQRAFSHALPDGHRHKGAVDTLFLIFHLCGHDVSLVVVQARGVVMVRRAFGRLIAAGSPIFCHCVNCVCSKTSPDEPKCPTSD